MSITLPSPVLPYATRVTRDGRPMRRAGDGPTTDHSVSLVVPAHDEAQDIPWVFEQIPCCVDEVILVRGAGSGSALRAGFAAATGEYIVLMNADGSMWPGEIPHYLHFLDNGYDFVKGSRRLVGGGSPARTRMGSIGNHLLIAVVNRLYHTVLTDLCYGFCAFRRSLLAELDLRAPDFEIEVEMVAHALRSGLRIAEVPSLELPRRSGRSHLPAVSDGLRVLRTLIAERPGSRTAAPLAGGEGMR
ncbi:hypothetical protein GCM10010193_48720 [Kitasatospora atroaurantiaca]|uniref:Glycosyltransferase involved in cell wall biosynthesis n=1 Tax=Kitasatospora atroaurantiaca TaxID=285545 RepID=A0A561EYR1_9ACTN|nr:glycosyltransferase family 2 protein [Kitasatospora atroaurantiaca]TWE20750.1 glycosyltransferase involved in cell wall biosynthesis [Kitasatospora atroaurantiaca]